MINSCARNSGKMLDATRTKYTSARTIDIYFDFTTHCQSFAEI